VILFRHRWLDLQSFSKPEFRLAESFGKCAITRQMDCSEVW
jgi:hypothetical protein